MIKLNCPECNSEKIKSDSVMRRCGPPKVIPPHLKHCFVSWGKTVLKNTCEDCKHYWEIDKEDEN